MTAEALGKHAKILLLSATLSVTGLGCSRHSGHGFQERVPEQPRAAGEQRSSTSVAVGRCPVPFFRTCQAGFLSGGPAVLDAEAGLVADCGRLFDLATGEYLGALKPEGQLLALISASQALFEARGGGLRLSHPLGADLAEDRGGAVFAWALSPDRSLVATIEAPEGRDHEDSGKPMPAPDVPRAAQMEPELVVRRLPSLKRVAAWPLPRGMLSGREPVLTFVDDRHLAYLGQPGYVTRRSLESGMLENWQIPGELSHAYLSSSARALLVERNDRRISIFALSPARELGETPASEEAIAHSAVSDSLEWLLTATESELQIYRRTPSGFELRDTLRGTDSEPTLVVDGECAAITLDDGVLVTGLSALLGKQRTDALLILEKAPGPIFERVSPRPTDFGGRAQFRAADDDRIELTIEALPKNLLARRALGGGQGWARSAVEYAARADPSIWFASDRLHAVWTTAEGSPAVEFRVGLRPGETCADHQRYVRVQQTAQALLVAQLNVPLGAEPERVQKLLEAGFDEPFGPIPTDPTRPPDTDDLRPCP